MPCDYSKYPANWKTEIRPRILERDGNCCKVCKVPNGAVGYRDKEGKFYSVEYIMEQLEAKGYDVFEDILSHCYDKKGNPTRPIKIVLTIMHLDHDTTNNEDSNLASACQYHHLNYDKTHHRINAKETINKKKKLQTLF